MIGIVRGGGNGTRLYPSTKAVNKHFFPVYDKPAIYYPISLLIQAGITDIIFRVNFRDQQTYRDLLGDGSRFGVSIRYQEETETVTIPGTLMECRALIGTQPAAVALGDNVFIGENLRQRLRGAVERFYENGGASVFCKAVEDPREFGVVEYDADGRILSLESKPRNPRSNYAVTGLFFFDETMFETIERTKPSEDGSVNFAEMLRQYLREGRLHSEILDDGVQWFDTGTPERLFQASAAVRDFQNSHASCAGSIEEAAFDCGRIDRNRLLELSAELHPTAYAEYLARRAEQSL
ncbi:MAG: sugar phosphate nucleotidyltransferase [Eubacteriales bacterium]|nr:sugar phosphate nucleotidyltransferase [Eubacteriales bacterium]